MLSSQSSWSTDGLHVVTFYTLKVLKLNEVATDLRSLRASGRMHRSELMCLLFAHMQTLAAPSVHVQVPSWQAFASSELVASRVPGGQIHTQSQTVWPCLYRASLRGSQRSRWCTAARNEFHHWNCPIWRSLFCVFRRIIWYFWIILVILNLSHVFP